MMRISIVKFSRNIGNIHLRIIKNYESLPHNDKEAGAKPLIYDCATLLDRTRIFANMVRRLKILCLIEQIVKVSAILLLH